MKCQVAIIDSGVNQFYFNNIKKCLNYTEEGFLDENGHGTKNISLIDKMSPETEFTVIKVLNKDLQCSSYSLLKALTDVLTLDVDVINLSLSTKIETVELLQVCKEIYKAGKLIIASKANNGEKSFPAEYKYVLGVCGSLFHNNNTFWYRANEPIQIAASKTPTIFKINENRYSFYGGNSKAAACISGIISSNWGTLSKKNIINSDYLFNLSERTNWFDHELVNDIYYNEIEETNNDIEKIVKKLFEKYTSIQFDAMLEKDMIYKKIGFHNLENIFTHIIGEFDLNDVSGEFDIFDFISLKSICSKIQKLRS